MCGIQRQHSHRKQCRVVRRIKFVSRAITASKCSRTARLALIMQELSSFRLSNSQVSAAISSAYIISPRLRVKFSFTYRPSSGVCSSEGQLLISIITKNEDSQKKGLGNCAVRRSIHRGSNCPVRRRTARSVNAA